MNGPDPYRALLAALNRGIEGVEVPEHAGDGGGRRLFVTGVPRSGTTLLCQLLTATGVLGYVSNLVARFYRNPAFGAGVQELLRPLLSRAPMDYTSEYGRTEAWYQPHEFGFYWERHFPFQESHDPPEGALEEVDWALMDDELTALSAVLGRPLVFKNNVLALLSTALATRLPHTVFVEVRRDPVDVAHSIFRARERESGGASAWWSTRVRRWRELESLPPVEQIVEQIAAIDEAHDRTRKTVGDKRWLTVEYAGLCGDPRGTVDAVFQQLGLEGEPRLDQLPTSFPVSVAERGSVAELAEVESFLARRGVRESAG